MLTAPLHHAPRLCRASMSHCISPSSSGLLWRGCSKQHSLPPHAHPVCKSPSMHADCTTIAPAQQLKRMRPIRELAAASAWPLQEGAERSRASPPASPGQGQLVAHDRRCGSADRAIHKTLRMTAQRPFKDSAAAVIAKLLRSQSSTVKRHVFNCMEHAGATATCSTLLCSERSRRHIVPQGRARCGGKHACLCKQRSLARLARVKRAPRCRGHRGRRLPQRLVSGAPQRRGDSVRVSTQQSRCSS